MKRTLLSFVFAACGVVNIAGPPLFSRGFSNAVLNEADPVVMSNFGLMMIMVWGLAYLAAAAMRGDVKWLLAAFIVEKLVYVVNWGLWIGRNDLGALYAKDLFAGVFYSLYGFNDFLFMILFIAAFIFPARFAASVKRAD